MQTYSEFAKELFRAWKEVASIQPEDNVKLRITEKMEDGFLFSTKKQDNIRIFIDFPVKDKTLSVDVRPIYESWLKNQKMENSIQEMQNLIAIEYDSNLKQIRYMKQEDTLTR